MKQQGLITLDECGDVRSAEARFFLNLLYTVAWESRKKDYNQSQEKMVIREDRQHRKLGEFYSMSDARKAMGMSKSGMINAIKNRLLTRKGYYFRYADENLNGG